MKLLKSFELVLSATLSNKIESASSITEAMTRATELMAEFKESKQEEHGDRIQLVHHMSEDETEDYIGLEVVNDNLVGTYGLWVVVANGEVTQMVNAAG